MTPAGSRFPEAQLLQHVRMGSPLPAWICLVVDLNREEPEVMTPLVSRDDYCQIYGKIQHVAAPPHHHHHQDTDKNRKVWSYHTENNISAAGDASMEDLHAHYAQHSSTSAPVDCTGYRSIIVTTCPTIPRSMSFEWESTIVSWTNHSINISTFEFLN